jgi:hypothetical protein
MALREVMAPPHGPCRRARSPPWLRAPPSRCRVVVPQVSCRAGESKARPSNGLPPTAAFFPPSPRGFLSCFDSFLLRSEIGLILFFISLFHSRFRIGLPDLGFFILNHGSGTDDGFHSSRVR